jgi:hypothetical protein
LTGTTTETRFDKTPQHRFASESRGNTSEADATAAGDRAARDIEAPARGLAALIRPAIVAA